MSKFTLLTTLTLNAAGFDQGINKAKRKTEELKTTVSSVGKAITGALSFAGIALSFQGAISVLKSGLSDTGAGADLLTKRTLQLNDAVQALSRSIVQGDLSNLAANIKNAMIAAGEYADEMDKQDTRTSDLSVKKSYLDARIKELQALQAEGKLTIQQAAELKKYNEEVHQTEIDILEAKIAALTKYGIDAKKGNIEINKDLFNIMQQGVVARADLSDDELENVAKVKDEYKKVYDDLYQEFTTKAESVSMGPGMSNTSTTMVTNWTKMSEGINKYIETLSDVERVQLFEDMFSSPEEWKMVISYFNQLNMSMGEYERNTKKILRADKNSGDKTPVAEIPRETPINVEGGMEAVIPKLTKDLENLKLLAAEPAKVFYDTWYVISEQIAGITDSIANMFWAMSNSIQDATQDGKVTFAEAMNVMASAAMALIPVLQALSIAGLIQKETTTKGLIGVLTAIAGIATIIGLFATFAKPKKMAAGGIVYGDSLVNVGEYANASSNPEVIAPLDKLTNIIGGTGGEVTFRIEDNVLVGVLERYNRRTNGYR